MDTVTIVIAIIFIVLIILLFVLTFIFKNARKKSLLNTIDRLTALKNSIISASLITELSKAGKLVNNKKIEKDVEVWKERFEKIEKVDLPKLTDKLVDVETFCINQDYAGAYNKLASVEKDILHVRAKSYKLLNEIKELTESEDRNREAITKLKSLYREIVFKYNKNKDDYSDISSRIDLQFENIDKLFSAFEVSVQDKEYGELSKIVKVLDDMINIGVKDYKKRLSKVHSFDTNILQGFAARGGLKGMKGSKGKLR